MQKVAVEEEHIAGVHLDVDELERVLGHGQPLGVGSGLSPDLEQGKGFEPVTTRTVINNRPLIIKLVALYFQ